MDAFLIWFTVFSFPLCLARTEETSYVFAAARSGRATDNGTWSTTFGTRSNGGESVRSLRRTSRSPTPWPSLTTDQSVHPANFPSASPTADPYVAEFVPTNTPTKPYSTAPPSAYTSEIFESGQSKSSFLEWSVIIPFLSVGLLAWAAKTRPSSVCCDNDVPEEIIVQEYEDSVVGDKSTDVELMPVQTRDRYDWTDSGATDIAVHSNEWMVDDSGSEFALMS